MRTDSNERGNEIEIGGIAKEAMDALLAFLYGAALPVSLNFGVGGPLTKAAHECQVRSLVESCGMSLRSKLSPDNAIRAAILGDLYGDDCFKKDAIAFIVADKTPPSKMVGWDELEQYQNLKMEIISKRARV